MTLKQRARQIDHRTDALLSRFDTAASSMVSKAQVHVALKLRSQLDLTPAGDIRPTARNARVINSLPKMFEQVMQSEGYDQLVSSFVSSFDGGLPTFESVLSDITKQYEIKPVTFTDADVAYFNQIKQGVVLNLEDVVSTAGEAARKNALFSLNGRPFDKMAVSISERLHVTLGAAQTMAATGISTFHRVVAKRGYDAIEAVLGPVGKQLEYTYVGPDDKLTRPFCENLVQKAEGRTWHKTQIDVMNNGQLPDVFSTGGGYNCRHQWIVALEHGRG